MFMLLFASLILISGVFCFLLQEQWLTMGAQPKSIMYAVVGLSLAFALSFSFMEFVNTGVFDRCCRTDFENNPILSTRKQVALVFLGTTFMGGFHGLMFGLADIEDDNARHEKYTENLIWSIPLGASVGFPIGLINQWIRSSPNLGSSYKSDRTPILRPDDDI